jgi:hypothetical protein
MLASPGPLPTQPLSFIVDLQSVRNLISWPVEFGLISRAGEAAFAAGGRAEKIFRSVAPKTTKEILMQFRFSYLRPTIS